MRGGGKSPWKLFDLAGERGGGEKGAFLPLRGGKGRRNEMKTAFYSGVETQRGTAGGVSAKPPKPLS